MNTAPGEAIADIASLFLRRICLFTANLSVAWLASKHSVEHDVVILHG